jgi:dipeptidyl aminopeptidase/acylaminoacyl peptidase
MIPTLEQLLRVPHVDSSYSFDISPDGERLAFSWNQTGAWELYEIGLAPSGQTRAVAGSEPRLLTLPPGGKFRPRYSPDGTRLAYALDLDGSESFHVAVYDFASRQHRDLTPGISFAHQPNVSWSPDGRELAVLSDARGHFSLYRLSVDSREVSLLLDIDHPCWDAHWSPAGDCIAVETEWHGQDRSIFFINTADGSSWQLRQGDAVLNAMHPAWSPDGRTLAFCSDPGGWYRIGLYDLASRHIRWLEAAEGECTQPAWSPDGTHIACIQATGADTSLQVCELFSRRTKEYRAGPGIHAHPHFACNGERILLLFEDPRHPPDLWQLEPAGGTFSQLTNSLPADIETGSFVIPEEIRYPSVDGTLVPAMLYRPAAGNAPALVNIHGGPGWLYQRNWHPLMSYLAAHGWAVLAPNYRGSTGYGRDWTQSNYMRLGEVDTFDCAAGAQYLVREGLADPLRIVVSGRSHGGYLTMTCLTEYPELWAGGSAIVPFMNWFTAHESVREDLQHWDIENFGDPAENAQLWRRRSPFFYLDRIEAGVQLICGGLDPRCPASESIAARDRLEQLGRQVELTLYPDEGHGFLKTENVVDHELRRLAFLERLAAAEFPKA